MTQQERPHLGSRRDLLRTWGAGMGAVALGGLTHGFQAHRATKAKRVIFLCMAGGPSHVDTFDYKPTLNRDEGKQPSGQGRRGAKLMGSPWKFQQHGQSGLWISELFPHLAKHADELCLLRGMHTEVPVHPQAFVRMHTGSSQFVRPSLGSWTLYGLGASNENLPGFVTLNPPSSQGGAQNYGSAFLPASYQGQRIGIERESRSLRRDGDKQPIANLRNPRATAQQQRHQLDLTEALNDRFARRKQLSKDVVQGVQDSYELAYRMQSEIPELLDLAKEDDRTMARYGIGQEATDKFGRQCLSALRFAEAGVRFIEVNQGGWDHHNNLREDLSASCAGIDRPIAALLEDLRKTGLLEETLVLWAGEFGRTPYAQGGDGRDHNHRGYTTWMAGGGVRGGFSYGATDEHGAEAVEGRISTHDWHATILHLLGLDHERLTYPYAGREFRLTDVHGRVVEEILA